MMAARCHPVTPMWRSIFCWALFAIHALVIVLTLVVLLYLIGSTFCIDGRFTLDAWGNTYQSLDRWIVLLFNTAYSAIVAITVSCSLGTILGFLLFRTNVALRWLGIGAIGYLATVPLYVVEAGVLAPIGLEPLRESCFAVGCIHGLAYLPWVVLIIGLTSRSVPRIVEEAAVLEGADWLTVLRRVTLPVMAGAIPASAILVFLLVATDYTVSDVLLVRTFAEEVYTQFALYGRPHEATLVKLPLMIFLAIVLTIFGRWFIAREGVSRIEMAPYVFPLGKARWVVSGTDILADRCGHTYPTPLSDAPDGRDTIWAGTFPDTVRK